MIRGWRYGTSRRSPRRAEFVGEVSRPNDDEGLTGLIGGESASDLEERLARAFYKTRKKFEYQVEIPVRSSLPGEERMVDFIVDGVQPVEPDGYIGHYRTISQRANDIVREQLLNEWFAANGMRPMITIPYYKLETQWMADQWVRRNL